PLASVVSLLSCCVLALISFFFFNDTAPPELYTLSLHDALPIFSPRPFRSRRAPGDPQIPCGQPSRGPRTVFRRDASVLRKPRNRSEEHTSELQSRRDLVCRLLLEKKKNKKNKKNNN